MKYKLLAEELSTEFQAARDEFSLRRALEKACNAMGFDHFALAFDFRPHTSAASGILIHDYPEQWATVYETFGLAGTDPVRRACDRSVTGFEWRVMDELIPMSRQDQRMLAVGRDCGVGDGYTIPRHLPGEASGSCTFVVRPGSRLPSAMLFVAEIVGALALASAGRVAGIMRTAGKPLLSERQRQCLFWSALGKTAPEIARILGISKETVDQHLKLARARYDVGSRQSLILCALFDGVISFRDIFQNWRIR